MECMNFTTQKDKLNSLLVFSLFEYAKTVLEVLLMLYCFIDIVITNKNAQILLHLNTTSFIHL